MDDKEPEEKAIEKGASYLWSVGVRTAILVIDYIILFAIIRFLIVAPPRDAESAIGMMLILAMNIVALTLSHKRPGESLKPSNVARIFQTSTLGLYLRRRKLEERQKIRELSGKSEIKN